MRRSEREITDPKELEAIILRAQVCRLAMCLDGQPYVVPLNYGYKDGCVYFHCAPEGRKLETIRANPKVCFEVDLDHLLVEGARACKFGYKYRSVIGFGRASLVQDPEERLAGLRAVMDHYADGPHQFDDKTLETVAVIKIELESLTGKQAGY